MSVELRARLMRADRWGNPTYPIAGASIGIAPEGRPVQVWSRADTRGWVRFIYLLPRTRYDLYTRIRGVLWRVSTRTEDRDTQIGLAATHDNRLAVVTRLAGLVRWGLVPGEPVA